MEDANRKFEIGGLRLDLGSLRLEIGSRRSEVGDRRPEVGSRKSEARRHTMHPKITSKSEAYDWTSEA